MGGQWGGQSMESVAVMTDDVASFDGIRLKLEG